MALLQQIARFGIVGILATCVHYVVALILIKVLNAYLANLCGYLIAVGVSFVGHRKYTFETTKMRDNAYSQFIRFIFTSFSALLLSQLVLAGTRLLATPTAIGLAIAVLSIPPYTFIISRSWVFRAEDKGYD